jgi:F0F1-type ATP synthase gamma subunit
MLILLQNLFLSAKEPLSFLSRTRRDLLADFSLPDKPRYSDIKPIIEFLLRAYGEDQIDTIEVLHTGFVILFAKSLSLYAYFL